MTWQNVYYHFRTWISTDSFATAWDVLLKKNSSKLDMSIINLDGSHTITKRGGYYSAYQARKKARTTNSLYLTDKQGVIIAVSDPIAGNHNDLFDIKIHFQKMLNDLHRAEIQTEDLFLNADAGFDSNDFRMELNKEKIVANIPKNKRNSKKTDAQNDDYQHFDELCYQNRFVIERSFAWLDAFKNTLIRFDFLAATWSTFVKISMIFVLIRKLVLPFPLS